MDRLSPETRAAEIEIDSAYKSNPLVKSNFAVAAWNVLGVIEDALFLPLVQQQGITPQKFNAAIDHYIYTLKHPFYWLRVSCPPGGRVPTSYDGNNYQAAIDLIKLGGQYDPFCLAFTYASRGVIGLGAEEQTLVPTHNFLSESRYEAYNRLTKPIGENTPDEIRSSEDLHEKIEGALRIKGENFSVAINPKMVKLTADYLRSKLNKRFLLPAEWKFSRYSLSDFKQIYDSIVALAYIQYIARTKAAALGCVGLGFANCLFLPTKEELLNRVARYTDLPRQVITYVLYDLTLGSHNIPPERGDPALQPLIALNEERYAVAPFLWIHNAAERNFIALMNKIPQEKSIYSRLVQQKEDLMRERINANLPNKDWRTWSGRVAGRSDLPDIDLALIDDSEKVCILIELKWFLDPAEAKEVVEKSEEIAKGISQLLLLKQAIYEGYSPIFECLGIDLSYSVNLTLVSVNWIGHASVQNPEVAVVREDHLIEKLSVTSRLFEVSSWLSERQYLPEEGKHYEIINTSPRVGNWKMNWYGVRPLISKNFLPT
ncbi:MAG TPA: hypothetical protein VGC87_09815 [Pyrinomonadaceae bacterium]|jgi:hypothetical protein